MKTHYFSPEKQKKSMEMENDWESMELSMVSTDRMPYYCPICDLNQSNKFFICFRYKFDRYIGRAVFPLSSTCQVLLSIVIDRLAYHKSQLNLWHPSWIPYFIFISEFLFHPKLLVQCHVCNRFEQSPWKVIEKLIFKLVNFRSYYFPFAYILWKF